MKQICQDFASPCGRTSTDNLLRCPYFETRSTHRRITFEFHLWKLE